MPTASNLTVAQAAVELGITTRHVRYLIAHGVMGAEKAGKRLLLIPRGELAKARRRCTKRGPKTA